MIEALCGVIVGVLIGWVMGKLSSTVVVQTPPPPPDVEPEPKRVKSMFGTVVGGEKK